MFNIQYLKMAYATIFLFHCLLKFRLDPVKEIIQ